MVIHMNITTHPQPAVYRVPGLLPTLCKLSKLVSFENGENLKGSQTQDGFLEFPGIAWSKSDSNKKESKTPPTHI